MAIIVQVTTAPVSGPRRVTYSFNPMREEVFLQITRFSEQTITLPEDLLVTKFMHLHNAITMTFNNYTCLVYIFALFVCCLFKVRWKKWQMSCSTGISYPRLKRLSQSRIGNLVCKSTRVSWNVSGGRNTWVTASRFSISPPPPPDAPPRRPITCSCRPSVPPKLPRTTSILRLTRVFLCWKTKHCSISRLKYFFPRVPDFPS